MTPAAHGCSASQPGPPPAFDSELVAVLDVIGEQLPSALTPDLIPVLRQPNPKMPPPTDDDLRRGGAFEVSERPVPGPAGAPEVSLLICRPARVTASLAAVYHTHGAA